MWVQLESGSGKNGVVKVADTYSRRPASIIRMGTSEAIVSTLARNTFSSTIYPKHPTERVMLDFHSAETSDHLTACTGLDGCQVLISQDSFDIYYPSLQRDCALTPHVNDRYVGNRYVGNRCVGNRFPCFAFSENGRLSTIHSLIL